MAATAGRVAGVDHTQRGKHRTLAPTACCPPVCVQIVCASICGWGYAFMVTILPVQKGYELLYDYGHSYCESAAAAYVLLWAGL